VSALDITFEDLFANENDTPDPVREAAMERILLLIRDIPPEELQKLADIIQLILILR